MSKNDFEKIYQLHCSEDIVNVQLALVLIKPRMTNYSRWVSNKVVKEIINARTNVDYDYLIEDVSKCIRLFGFISREDNENYKYSYILRLFKDFSKLQFNYTTNLFWRIIFKSQNELGQINLKLKHINELIDDMNFTDLHDSLFQLIKCILTKEIYGRFKSY